MTEPTIDIPALLADLDACGEAIDYARGKTPYQAWRQCQHGDWLLWLAAHLGVERKILVSAACACARTALKYVPTDEGRPLAAIEAAESWCAGMATLGAVRKAAQAAARAAAQAAARAAADAADAAYAANAAYAAAYAAYAAYAADAADAADAAAHAAHAQIVRRIIPYRVVRDAALAYQQEQTDDRADD